MAKKRTHTRQDKELIALLIEHEVGMRTLYRKFAKNFPQLEQFWLKVAEEEQDHVHRLATLKKKTTIKDDKTFKDRMKTGAVKTSLYYLKRELEGINRIRNINEAFAIALDFEHSMLEKKFFQVFNVFTPKMEKALEFLENETHKHVADLKKQFDKIKKASKKKA